jgi:hypothetical protein
MPKLSYFDLFFKPLDASCNVSQFHSTEQELDDFLKEDALKNKTVKQIAKEILELQKSI